MCACAFAPGAAGIGTASCFSSSRVVSFTIHTKKVKETGSVTLSQHAWILNCMVMGVRCPSRVLREMFLSVFRDAVQQCLV